MSGIVQSVVTPSPNKRSLRAALKALFTAREDEADGLRRVIDSPETSLQEKERAQRELQSLSKDTLLRMAKVVDGAEVNTAAATPVLESPLEIPSLDVKVAEPLEDGEAA